MGYKLRWQMRTLVLLVTFLVAIVRLLLALDEWRSGHSSGIQSYVFCVVFPASLIVALSLVTATQTKEGLLMRFGTILQLLLILAIPPFSLHLALGLPIVFFAVELFVTRLPSWVTMPIERSIIE